MWGRTEGLVLCPGRLSPAAFWKTRSSQCVQFLLIKGKYFNLGGKVQNWGQWQCRGAHVIRRNHKETCGNYWDWTHRENTGSFLARKLPRAGMADLDTVESKGEKRQENSSVREQPKQGMKAAALPLLLSLSSASNGTSPVEVEIPSKHWQTFPPPTLSNPYLKLTRLVAIATSCCSAFHKSIMHLEE